MAHFKRSFPFPFSSSPHQGKAAWASKFQSHSEIGNMCVLQSINLAESWVCPDGWWLLSACSGMLHGLESRCPLFKSWPWCRQAEYVSCSSCCYNKSPDKSNLLKERFVLAQSDGAVHHGAEAGWQENEAAGHLHPKSGSRVMRWCSVCSPLFIPSGTPARGMVPPLTSVNPV